MVKGSFLLSSVAFLVIRNTWWGPFQIWWSLSPSCLKPSTRLDVNCELQSMCWGSSSSWSNQQTKKERNQVHLCRRWGTPVDLMLTPNTLVTQTELSVFFLRHFYVKTHLVYPPNFTYFGKDWLKCISQKTIKGWFSHLLNVHIRLCFGHTLLPGG